MHYKIKTEQFEGPLDLLLELIEKEKLDITQMSLAQIADEYLEYVEDRGNISLESLADFLWVASRIILIKSKALLPHLQLSDEEEEEIKDLEYQLAEYKKFKDVSIKIGRLFGLSRIGFSREGFSGISVLFYPPENINVFDLKKTYVEILQEIPTVEKLEEEAVREIVTLEERINHFQDFLRKKIETSFSEIAGSSADKADIIISFLAMLEMVKQRVVEVDQNMIFNDIKIRKI